MTGVDGERSPLLTNDEEQQLRLSTSSSSATLCETPKVQKPAPLFPWRPVISILLLCAVQPIGFELIFPFINQMIVENGIVTDPERVGYYSGIIESTFAFMSFVSVLPCSYLSDHYGRKPVVLAGTLGLALSIGLFGMAKEYWLMIATRCIGGMLGGTWATIKVMLVETTDKSQQGLAFSAFSISYRMGQIVGQPLGGLLVHPEKHFKVFDTSFWHNYPFALPCFISSAFAIFAVVFAIFAVDETLPAIRRKKARANYGAIDGSEDSTINSASAPEREQLKKPRPSLMSTLTPQVVSAYITCAALALTSEMVFAIYPLLAFTPIASGGLGLSEAQIGVHMASRSINSIVVTTAYAPLVRCLGALNTHRLSMAFWPICVTFFPILNVMARRGWEESWWFEVAVGVCFTVWSLACLGWTSSNVILNDAAPSPEALSVINGMGQMAMSLPLAIAPAFSTTLFAFSIKSNILYGNLIWAVIFGMGAAGFLHSLTLRESTHNWRDELEEDGVSPEPERTST